MLYTKRVHFRNLAFDVSENVYEPAEDSFLFAENLAFPLGSQVLDMGTGCGLLAILAATQGGKVLAVDLNPFAVRCAKHNSHLNKLSDKVSFLQTDLFSAFDKTAKFDIITFNAPYLPAPESESMSWIGRSWAGGIDGRQVIDKFIFQAPLHLKPKGKIFLMQSTLADEEKTIALFGKHKLMANVIATCNLPFFETLMLMQARFV